MMEMNTMEMERNIALQLLIEPGTSSSEVRSSELSFSPLETCRSKSSSPDSFDKALSKCNNFPYFVINCDHCMERPVCGNNGESGIYRIGKSPSLGHYVLSLKNLLEGMVIFHELPILTMPRRTSDPGSTFCINCYKPVDVNPGRKVRGCHRCGWPMCRFATCDALVNFHTQEECEFFRAKGVSFSNSNTNTFEFDTFWFKFWEKIRIYDPVKIEQVLALRCYNTEHLDLTPTTPTYREGIISARAANLKESSFSDDKLVKLMHICRTNLFPHRSDVINGIKCADTLYKTSSQLNHSCFPNLMYVNSPTFHISWITAREIIEGEMLTICYLDLEDLLLEPTISRRNLLMKRYQFLCECRRCMDPTELGTYFDCLPCFSCVRVGRTGEEAGHMIRIDQNLYLSDWQCDICGHVFVGSKVELCLHQIKKNIEDMGNEPGAYIELNNYVNDLVIERCIHKYHRLVFLASIKIISGIRTELRNNWQQFSVEEFVPFLQAANCIHHLFTTFVPGRREYRGQILAIVVTIRFAGMLMSLESCEISIQDVEREIQRCFFSETDESGNSQFSSILDLGKVRQRNGTGVAIFKTMNLVTRKLVYSAKRRRPEKVVLHYACSVLTEFWYLMQKFRISC